MEAQSSLGCINTTFSVLFFRSLDIRFNLFWLEVRLMLLGAKNLEHTFSVEIRSKKYVKNISISDESHDRVLFEGNLGELLELSLVEDVLEFIGANGILRVGLTEDQLRKALKSASQVSQGGEKI